MPTRIWTSTSSTNMNDYLNYNGTGAILSIDDLVFSATSINAIATSAVYVNSINITSGYYGLFDCNNFLLSATEGVTYQRTVPSTNCQTLFGYVYKLTRLPVTVANIIVHVKELNTIVNNTLITSRDSNVTTTTGYFEINLIQGAEVEIIIKDQGTILYQNTITVTTDATKDLSTYSLN